MLIRHILICDLPGYKGLFRITSNGMLSKKVIENKQRVLIFSTNSV
jgi:hypothetical protein